jgi:type IV secretory pathway VirB10-like protein
VTPARAGRAGLALVLALMLALASCGGDDEESAATTETQPPPTAEPAPTATEETEAATEETEAEEPEAETEPAEPEPEPAETEAPTSPEDQPGGAGDEEPARSLALLTGEGGRITPRTIRVPAFISIRVELRAEDGREYGLTFDGNTLRVSGGLSSVSTTIDGLRPGEAVVGTPIGAGNRVRIEATAEPGP